METVQLGFAGLELAGSLSESEALISAWMGHTLSLPGSLITAKFLNLSMFLFLHLSGGLIPPTSRIIMKITLANAHRFLGGELWHLGSPIQCVFFFFKFLIS